MKFFKKSYITIGSFAFMLVLASYINYRYNPEREKNLGQTVYVNNNQDFVDDECVSIYGEKNTSTENVESLKNVDEEESSATDNIAIFRYERDNMYSEMIENYNKVISNQNTTKEKVNEYQDKLNEIISKKNLINMIENVIKAYDVEDVVIIPTNNENINVIIKSQDEVDKSLIAKINQIITYQLGVSADKITIKSVKN